MRPELMFDRMPGWIAIAIVAQVWMYEWRSGFVRMNAECMVWLLFAQECGNLQIAIFAHECLFAQYYVQQFLSLFVQ